MMQEKRRAARESQNGNHRNDTRGSRVTEAQRPPTPDRAHAGDRPRNAPRNAPGAAPGSGKESGILRELTEPRHLD
jgi:hypothetical protein